MTSGEVVVTVLVAILGGGSLLGILVGKLVPQRSSREDRLQRVESEVAEHRKVINAQADYIGDLRKHIADGLPPPPPDWPEGLKVR